MKPKMAKETQSAIDWALQQCIEGEGRIFCVQDKQGNVDHHLLVDFVRKYFNEHDVEYNTFSYADLEPFLN